MEGDTLTTRSLVSSTPLDLKQTLMAKEPMTSGVP